MMTFDLRDPLPRECCSRCHKHWSVCRCDEASERRAALARAMRARDDRTAIELLGGDHG